MLGRPLDRETESARREPPVEDLEAPNRNLDLEFAVHGVEVRRVMVVEVHLDNDPEEPRDLRHDGTVLAGAWLGLI